MRPISALLPVALLCMAALVPAAAEARYNPKQAVFDLKATGRYSYDRVVDAQPGSDCVQRRGHVEDHKSFAFTLHLRVNVQNVLNRWYLNPIGHRGRFLGKGRLSDVVTTSPFEVNYGCDGPAAWERDPAGGTGDRPRSLRCSTRMPMVVDIYKGRLALYPLDRRGKCRFRVERNVFFPPLVLNLKATRERVSTRRLASNSRRPFVVKVDKRRDYKPKLERDESMTMTTTTSAAASWKLTLKRRGAWRPWR